MSFRDVIYKNFRKNIKKYLSYYLSGTFCVAMFFIYSTLMFLDSVMHAQSEYPLSALFVVSCSIVCVFSIIFINYAHHMFIKNKKQELGIYMVVGMDERMTRKMLAIETVVIAFASIVSGIVIGALFSRFFQIIVQKLLDLDDITFQIKFVSFVLTLIVFLVLYLLCFLVTDYQIQKEDILSILKANHKKDGKSFRKVDIILLLLGIGLMIFSALFIVCVASNNRINSKVWVLLTFIGSGYVGLFLVVKYGVKSLVYICQRRVSYYRYMLTVSGIHHRFEQNSKTIIMLAMMASMIVLLVGSPIALVSISADIAENGNSDLSYVTFSSYDVEKVNHIVEQKEIKSREKIQIHYFVEHISGDINPVLSVSEYNEQMGTNLVVGDGEVYHMITSWEPGNHGVAAGDSYTIDLGGTSHNYKVCDSVKGDWNFSSLFSSKSILVLSDQDYQNIEPMLSCAEMNQIMYQENWRDTGSIIQTVKTELNEELGSQYYVSSIWDIYHTIRAGYSVFLFVSGFMCFMFFISTGCVLFFKQYNEIDEEREQYRQLYQIGVRDVTVKMAISAKLAVVYFVPLLGSVMGIMISYYMASLFGSGTISNLFIRKALIGVICYAISQTIFYLILRSKYLHDVMQGNEVFAEDKNLW